MTAKLNLSLTTCNKCHAEPGLKSWLLAPGCTPDPALKVAMRGWFPPRGWAGATTPGSRALLVLATNPGHPLPAEATLWSGWPTEAEDAHRVTVEQAATELDFVSRLYRQSVRGRTAFHTRTVQLTRAVLHLLGRAGRSLREDWFDNVWFSDVVKCSTAKESGSPGIRDLARACRKNLESEIVELAPDIILTLGDAVLEAVQGVVFQAKVLAGPHPSGCNWRKIDRTDEGAVQQLMEDACAQLGLDWFQEREPLQRVRASLAKNPWGPIG